MCFVCVCHIRVSMCLTVQVKWIVFYVQVSVWVVVGDCMSVSSLLEDSVFHCQFFFWDALVDSWIFSYISRKLYMSNQNVKFLCFLVLTAMAWTEISCGYLFRTVDWLVGSLTWNRWKSNSLSYFLDKRTVQLVSGASMVFSCPKIQWLQIFERLNLKDLVGGSDNVLCETIVSRFNSWNKNRLKMFYQSLEGLILFCYKCFLVSWSCLAIERCVITDLNTWGLYNSFIRVCVYLIMQSIALLR